MALVGWLEHLSDILESTRERVRARQAAQRQPSNDAWIRGKMLDRIDNRRIRGEIMAAYAAGHKADSALRGTIAAYRSQGGRNVQENTGSL